MGRTQVLHDQADARTLGMARIWIFGLAALSRFDCPAWEACYIPDYYPVGIMKLVGGDQWVPLLTPSAGMAIQAVTVALLTLVAAGIGPYRILAPLACIAFTISEGMVRGVGVIPHAHMVLLLSSYVLCCFPAADALTPFRQQKPLADPAMYRAPLVAASLVLSFSYMLAAGRRFANGGFAIYFDNSILCATAARDAELGSAGGWGVWACESWVLAWALCLGFPVVTLLEYLSPLYIFSKRFRWVWIAVMLPFHIGTGILMGIWFTYNILLIPILVGGWDPFRARVANEQPAEPRISRIADGSVSQAA